MKLSHPLVVACIFLLMSSSAIHADIITIEGVVKSVDAKKRTITVETGAKERTLDVSSKTMVSVDGQEEKIDILKNGQVVRLSFHEQLEVVVKIEVKASRAEEDQKGFVSLFDGKTLDGWSGDERYWKVENDSIVGVQPGKLKGGTFLSSMKEFENFILKAKFKLLVGNSGIQFRSRNIAANQLAGYQADIAYGDFKFMGCLASEGLGQGVIAPTSSHIARQLSDAVLLADWNEFVIKAEGDRITLEINGIKTVDVHHDGPKTGLVGFQLHGGTPTTVMFRDIKIKNLP